MREKKTAFREMKLDENTPLQVGEFRFRNLLYEVHIGIVPNLKLPMLEQLRMLKRVNARRDSSVSLISPGMADRSLSKRPEFFAGATSFFTSGVVFYPNAFCRLDDSAVHGDSRYLVFESGNDSVFLSRDSVDLSRFGSGDTLLLSDFGSCAFTSMARVGGGMDLTISETSSGAYRVSSFISGWHRVLNPSGSVWMPAGDFIGVTLPRRMTADTRQFRRYCSSGASPIVRHATEGLLRTVSMNSSFSAPLSMVVEIPAWDFEKFRLQR